MTAHSGVALDVAPVPRTAQAAVASDAFYRRECAAVMALALGGQASLALYYLEDKSAEEIGAILGPSTPTVRVHRHRGGQALEPRRTGGE